jgi:hypothetical protein
MIVAGAVWSLALLTKIHAWLLIPVVVVWSVICLRSIGRALLAAAAWASTGLGLFVLGWPWIWYDTLERLRSYLGTGVVRTSIQVLYFGQVYSDRDVPWHYPWVYSLVTVPIGLHVLALVGVGRAIRRRRDDRFPLLIAGAIGLLLSVFSTRVPVYDGERLFLPVFPLWAIFAGMGFSTIWEKLEGKRWTRAGMTALLLSQGFGVVSLHPFGLSYYNALVGGLRGAERFGLELTYWGDSVDRVLLDRLVRLAPPDASAALVPTLYPGQGINTTTRAMARRGILMGDQESVPRARWLIVYRRTAYWPTGFSQRLANASVVYERKRQGVWLSRIYQLGPRTAPRERSDGTRPTSSSSPIFSSAAPSSSIGQTPPSQPPDGL